DANYATGVDVGVSMYYGAGNCGEHSSLTYAYLVTFGYPGITIHRCSSTIMDHAFTVITWGNPNLSVLCDAWPSTPQACLWVHFFANPQFYNRPQPGFKPIAKHADRKSTRLNSSHA